MNLISNHNIETTLLSNFDLFVNKQEKEKNITYISFFNRWITREDIEKKKIATYYLDNNADNVFYIKYYSFEDKVISFFYNLFKQYRLYAFFPVNSEKETPVFSFIDKNDLFSTIKIFLRLDRDLCIYLPEKDILFNLSEDLTIKIFSKNNLDKEMNNSIINLDLNNINPPRQNIIE